MPARIAICLFDEYVDNLDAGNLMGGNPLSRILLNTPDPDTALYLKNSNTSKPEWVNILQGFSNINANDAITASSGAILFLKINNRIVGCCFGSSVGNINRNNVITDFGLAVAYNRISKKNYKGIETFTLGENPITNNRSAATPSSQNSFNLDTYLETITELSGKYFTSSKGVSIKGKEFFSIPAPLNLAAIKELCTNLIKDYGITINDENYKKLTAISKVKAKKVIEVLNDKLCEDLNKKSSLVHLVDYLQLDNIESYSLTPKGDKLSDIEIGDLYKDLKKGQKFTMDYLRTRRITVYDADEQQIDEWPLYKCLFSEISLNIGGHILYKGNWYEIQKRYLTDLKGFISSHEINQASLNLLPWDGVQKEGAYNIAAAAHMGGQCWDKILYTHSDFSYGIEFCDLLMPNHVIHVKKLASSSLNSHLLMQTYVSAQLLQADLGIRNWIKAQSKTKFRKNILLKASNEFKEPPINYLIVLMAGPTTKTLADLLPFFSLITFNMLIRRVSQLEFNVKICAV